MDDLFRQTRAVFVADPIEKQKFSKQIAFNVIPHIDVFLDPASPKRMEDDGGDAEILDPRHPGERDVRARAGLHRPFGIRHVEFEKPITAKERAPSCARTGRSGHR